MTPMRWNSPLWDRVCPEHGGLSHAVVHEAGHAVIARKYGFEFIDVSINPDPSKHPNDVGEMTGGGVRFASVDGLLAMLAADLIAGLHFCWAGVVTENLVFGHTLDRSGQADVNVWRNSAGLVDAQTEDTVNAALGVPLGDVYKDVCSEVTELWPLIKVLATALGDHDQMTLTWAEAVGLTVEITPETPEGR